MSWRREFDQLLIDSIQKYPYIYNVALEEFRNVNVKTDAWQAVAHEVGTNEADCQRRWRNLRDGYVRYKKSLKCSGSAGNKRHKDPIYGSMSFLDGFLKHRRSYSQPEFTKREFLGEVDDAMLSDDDSTSTQQESELQLTPQPKRRRVSDGKINDRQFLNAILATSPRSDDEFDSFGHSVAATLRRLTPRLQAAAKVKIQQLLFDLEFGETGANIANHDFVCS